MDDELILNDFKTGEITKLSISKPEIIEQKSQPKTLPAGTAVSLYSWADFPVLRSTDCRQILYGGGKQQSPTQCQISGVSVHIWGFVTSKNLQKSQILQTYSPRRGDSLNRYS